VGRRTAEGEVSVPAVAVAVAVAAAGVVVVGQERLLRRSARVRWKRSIVEVTARVAESKGAGAPAAEGGRSLLLLRGAQGRRVAPSRLLQCRSGDAVAAAAAAAAVVARALVSEFRENASAAAGG
jgi:hypothetical protein